MKKSDPLKFTAVKNLMKDYTRRFSPASGYETIKILIENYKDSGLFEKSFQRKEERFSLTRGLVEAYKKKPFFLKAVQYDLFRELRLKLGEDAISDITADMLNPKKSPFGKSIIVRLLKETGKEKIALIVERKKEEDISVRREQSGDNSRIDIRISTRDFSDENVIIDIELKVKSGSETSHKTGRPQTVREWEDLQGFAETMGVSKKNIAAYFVTPYGTKSKSGKFINLSRDKLNQIIWEELGSIAESTKIDSNGIGALRHFFGSSWLF